MTQALGNINLTDFASSAAAVHAKCLLCDKPVSSQQRTRTASSNSKAVMSQSLPQLYEKGMETKPSSSKKNLVPRLNSPQERVKVASEINILRSSMNALPEITVSFIAITICLFILCLLLMYDKGCCGLPQSRSRGRRRPK